MRDLEWITLLLLELIVKGAEACLLRLLRNGASGQCSLPTADCSVLCACPQASQSIGACDALSKNLIAEACLRLAGAGILIIELLPRAGQCGTVCLRRTEVDALLLLCSAKGLRIHWVKQSGNRCTCRLLLLPLKGCLRYSSTVAAKCASANGIAKQFLLIHLLLLT